MACENGFRPKGAQKFASKKFAENLNSKIGSLPMSHGPRCLLAQQNPKLRTRQPHRLMAAALSAQVSSTVAAGHADAVSQALAVVLWIRCGHRPAGPMMDPIEVRTTQLLAWSQQSATARVRHAITNKDGRHQGGQQRCFCGHPPRQRPDVANSVRGSAPRTEHDRPCDREGHRRVERASRWKVLGLPGGRQVAQVWGFVVFAGREPSLRRRRRYHDLCGCRRT